MHVSLQTFAKIVYWNTLAGLLVIGLAASAMVRRHHEVDALILRESRARGLDPLLVSAVVRQESGFNPAALGETGGAGLMQVTESAGKSWAEATGRAAFDRYDLFKPEVNIAAGTWHLAQALSAWAGAADPLPPALAEYRAGAANAKRWGDAAEATGTDFLDAVTFPGVQSYVRDILRRYRG